jgi:hypothetical protein
MKKMVQLINILEWFSIEMSSNELKSIQQIFKRLDREKPLISESYLKSLVNEES